MNLAFSKSYAAACRHGCGKSQPCVPRVYAAPRPEQVVGRPQQLSKQTIVQVASAEVADTRGGLSLENSSILPVQGRIHSIESFSTGMLQVSPTNLVTLVCRPRIALLCLQSSSCYGRTAMWSNMHAQACNPALWSVHGLALDKPQ